jgi:hypothetical protein
MTDFTRLDQTGGVGDIIAKEVIAKGHPPVAEKVILIDFDATIAPFGYLFSFPEPFKGVSKFANELRDAGYSIGVFTSRLSPTWLKSANQNEQDHIDYINEYCKRYNIPIDFITSEKRPSEAIIDDKAIEFRDNWDQISRNWWRRNAV